MTPANRPAAEGQQEQAARGITAEDRFWAKVDRRGPNECWPWLGQIDHRGYGRFRHRLKLLRSHRYSYELAYGPIPDGMKTDHLCHTRAVEQGVCGGGDTCLHRRCVNPAHLEAVTNQVNLLRGLGIAAVAARKTHCPQGHPYDLLNTHICPDGSRKCLTCIRAKDKGRQR